jgi:hypothetical protein
MRAGKGERRIDVPKKPSVDVGVPAKKIRTSLRPTDRKPVSIQAERADEPNTVSKTVKKQAWRPDDNTKLVLRAPAPPKAAGSVAIAMTGSFEKQRIVERLKQAGYPVTEKTTAIDPAIADKHISGGFAAVREALKRAKQPGIFDAYAADALKPKSSLPEKLLGVVGITREVAANRVAKHAIDLMNEMRAETGSGKGYQTWRDFADAVSLAIAPEILAAADRETVNELRECAVSFSQRFANTRQSFDHSLEHVFSSHVIADPAGVERDRQRLMAIFVTMPKQLGLVGEPASVVARHGGVDVQVGRGWETPETIRRLLVDLPAPEFDPSPAWMRPR